MKIPVDKDKEGGAVLFFPEGQLLNPWPLRELEVVIFTALAHFAYVAYKPTQTEGPDQPDQPEEPASLIGLQPAQPNPTSQSAPRAPGSANHLGSSGDQLLKVSVAPTTSTQAGHQRKNTRIWLIRDPSVGRRRTTNDSASKDAESQSNTANGKPRLPLQLKLFSSSRRLLGW